MTLHLGQKAELTGGVRYIKCSSTATPRSLPLIRPTCFRPSPPPLAPACQSFRLTLQQGRLVSTTTFPGRCELPIPGALRSNNSFNPRDNPVIWNASFTYHITPDLTTYVSAGSSWLRQTTTIGLSLDLSSNPDPLVQRLQFLPAATSRSVELGAKWTFLDGRGRLNVAYYHQAFTNLEIEIFGIRYTVPPSTPNGPNEQRDQLVHVRELRQRRR